MRPEGFEPPTFGSGIRRAAVAPWPLLVGKDLPGFEPGSKDSESLVLTVTPQVLIDATNSAGLV